MRTKAAMCGMAPWAGIVLRQVVNYQLDADELCAVVPGVRAYRARAKDDALDLRTCALRKWYHMNDTKAVRLSSKVQDPRLAARPEALTHLLGVVVHGPDMKVPCAGVCD